MKQQSIDYSKWDTIDSSDNDLQEEESLQLLRIEWHGKMTIADHQFYAAENSGLEKDYDKAIEGLVYIEINQLTLLQ